VTESERPLGEQSLCVWTARLHCTRDLRKLRDRGFAKPADFSANAAHAD
jgi:hypothetical protein